MDPKRIAIIGNGNVASHLITWIEEAGHKISSIHTRAGKDKIRNELHKGSLDYQGESCDIIIVATNDDSVQNIAQNLKNTGSAIVLHTSGTVSIDVFSNQDFRGHGVLYPLQTLQKGRQIALENVPFLIEANNNSSLQRIREFCKSCRIDFKTVSSNDRLLYHLSAVISSNFTNHLLYIAEKNLANSNLNMGVLRPLIEETISKAFENGAFRSQTGPAKREDTETMKKHMDLLNQKNYKDIYQLISDSIISEYYHNN